MSELCNMLQLPQSTVSRHLKMLADAGWVTSRRDGTSRYYALASDGPPGARTQIWELTRPQVAGRKGAEQDARRLERVLAGRRETSQRFFASSAGQWDHLREELFGSDFVSRPSSGCCRATGWSATSGAAPACSCRCSRRTSARVIGVDGSDEMLAAARERARGPAERRAAPRLARGAADRRRHARCRHDDARAASPAVAGAALAGSRARAEARRSPADRRHGAARPRGVPPAHGPRLAGFR